MTTETFVEQVKEVLEHLYDFPYLQSHQLAVSLGDVDSQPGETDGQRLRRKLIEVIESFNPGEEFFFRSPQARLYNLLHLHYVEGLTIQEASHELGISARQAYRDLRRGEQGVADILWQEVSKGSTVASDETPATALSSVEVEVALLKNSLTTIGLREIVETAFRAVERLAEREHVQIHITTPDTPLSVSTNAVIARQILVTALSHAIQHADDDHVMLEIQPTGDGMAITLNFQPDDEATIITDQKPFVMELCERLGWKLQSETPSQIVIAIRRQGPTILIIDDNEGLVTLLDRYLTGHTYQVISARQGWKGLELAQDIVPDAIILDIMMPEMDGWELLQRLKATPATADIPVIICSVFNDPELAFSLGASLFIPKPVSRNDILTALQTLEIA